ncbi:MULTISPECIES: cyanoexosortase A [unclassified Leptolyngbya]|uniref:cyanoexosortase A n=1 Tax=unclassified Leptolyngbya TaxID=2650499 RepID=UPI0016859BC1|nr:MULTISPECIES: cyanoexosortase A [unclassified Leptolyngbya]MBD1911487.1 cyanoexosortase A [Leptolyngbya sp. FACHB-8]MBD2155274.1 cyanoexosortase A [Leptolyngbya sp. FACHB-16]
MNTKASSLSHNLRLLRYSDFWLRAIATGLVSIQLTLVWRVNDADLLAANLLFLAVIASLLGDRWSSLSRQSTYIASAVGTVLLVFILLRSVGLPSTTFLLLAPLVAGLGLALLTSGFSYLRQYSQEFTALAFLGLPRVILPILLDPTPWTAKFASLILWYSGFSVVRDGLNIQMAGGAVEVYPGCSGIESMTHVLSLTGLFLVLVPLGWLSRLFLLVSGVFIAFMVNAFRVALMAYLVANSQPEAFRYWHEGTGSLIFSMIAVAIAGALCYLMMRLNDLEDESDWEDESDLEVLEE